MFKIVEFLYTIFQRNLAFNVRKYFGIANGQA